MSASSFTEWLTGWLRRHPVRELPAQEERALTESIMRRVRELPNPSVGRLPHGSRSSLASGSVARSRREPAVLIWWRSALGWGGGLAVAAAAALIALRLSVPAPAQMAADDAATDDTAWIAQTLELLNSLEDDVGVEPDAADPESEDEWLDELELLDDMERTG